VNTELLKVIERVYEIFKERGLTLSVAESCTGGLLSHCLTYLPGSSNIFIAGVVSYSASAKINILGISPETMARYGVVSRQTAEEMAERIRLITGSDYSISTTGNLGPDVLEGKEQGLIYIGISRKDRTISKELRLSGARNKNKEDACLMTLKFLLEMVTIAD
jgi:PncC family amidohydrolase